MKCGVLGNSWFYIKCCDCDDLIFVGRNEIHNCQISCSSCKKVYSNPFYTSDKYCKYDDLVNDYLVKKYSLLCNRLNNPNNSFNDMINIFDGFRSLDIYKDSPKKCRQCLNLAPLNSSYELSCLSNLYKSLEDSESVAISNSLYDISIQWKQYEKDFEKFEADYSFKPKLSKIFEEYLEILLIVGFITLLYGFIIYFILLMAERIYRQFTIPKKRESTEYKNKVRMFEQRKQKIEEDIIIAKKLF